MNSDTITLSCTYTYLHSLYLAGLFPYEIARSSVVPGHHNIRLFQRSAGEPIPDQILGGAQFQIDRKLECSKPIELDSCIPQNIAESNTVYSV